MNNILNKEENFHDNWALNENVDIDFIKNVTADTSPELKFLFEEMGDVKDKEVLDIGSGLGEFGLYLSYKGAKVTLLDISSEMLKFSKKIANKNNLNIEIIHGDINKIKINKKFDIIYAGNYLHHVNIHESILTIRSLLKDQGSFYSWDPLKYNFFINIYRKIANDVRTEDEHPLSYEDINLIKNNFNFVKEKYFWLFSLFTFIYMVFFQLKNPNKVRLWKEVVNKSSNYKYIYRPLSLFDEFFLKKFPYFRKYCWNVALVCKK